MEREKVKTGSRKRKLLQYLNRGQIDYPFLVLTLVLLIIGLIMLFSASYAQAIQLGKGPTFFFLSQAQNGALGIIVLLAASRFNYKKLADFWWIILLGSIVLLALVPLIGVSHNGAQRWLNLGIEFQPSEIAKCAVVIAFAAMAIRFREKMGDFLHGVLPFLLLLALIAYLLLKEPHYSAIVIITVTGVVMMFLGGTRFFWFVIMAVLAAAGYVLLQDKLLNYAQERFAGWLDPFGLARDEGYQIVQSLYAIGSGGLFGLGFGKSRQKYLYLPESQNDYIFPIICEELGFVGAMLILLLFVLLIIRGYWIAMHARDRFGALLAAGLTTLLALQVFFNVGVVTNLFPPTGISLPLFSSGGTALVLQLGELGLILGVSRQSDENLL